MEFWGDEVKPGMTVACQAGDGFVIHLSQAALGETKKGSENVLVFVKVGDKKLVIGTLSADKHPQISCDLIFDEAFELSHNSKTTSVFLCGYKSLMPDMYDSDEDEDEEMETEIPVKEIPVKKNETEKSAANVPAKDGKKDKQDSDSESDSETSSGTEGFSDSDAMSEDDSSDEVDTSSGTDDLSDDSEDDSEDEETPVPEVGKKRAAAAALKTSASDKKAKVSTPKETGDKKGVHVATPHPAKQASKTPAESKQKEKAPKTPADSKPKEKAPKTPADSKPKEKAPKTPADIKAKEKSPKSGSHSCKSCSKTFNSSIALESHQKAKKHEA